MVLPRGEEKVLSLSVIRDLTAIFKICLIAAKVCLLAIPKRAIPFAILVAFLSHFFTDILSENFPPIATETSTILTRNFIGKASLLVTRIGSVTKRAILKTLK